MRSNLAPYAVSDTNSRGRRIHEELPAGRSQFQRDRDRVIHSTAFRRLEYKTQVFVNHEGDLFRTRLTHSLEVAQIGRSIARNLNLNEELVEAITLSHDLGHTPFGHAGQDALNDCMKTHGGFEHNLQSLRVVDVLEERYAAFNGLNLCFETREGILKRVPKSKAAALGELGTRFLHGHSASLEAQLANLADEIAYNNHDVDDGLRSGLITLAQLEEIEIFARHLHQVKQHYPDITGRRLIHETVRGMINTLVVDLTVQSGTRIRDASPDSPDSVREKPVLIGFSDTIKRQQQELKRFLHKNLYKHYQVMRMSNKARHTIEKLFTAFETEPALLPYEYQQKFQEYGHQAIADYIAGMTDRYAIREYQRLFAITEN
ncbi:MAG TPA: deoxyguanosinetriphosphate triphosphohydrolase [Nitrosomonas europaea]|uniref:deoxyguanosinetriphosphate triphosphohydrolase n=1 Tax=Nitrosomonas europaea TaxID=915 RepID=UPI002492E9AB|nr:deoxyguanosinetriphosphate triphosphohydrolase [Nitrosomonas europaea]HRN82762.1 deoxyguanosinetriphosphate triphosphohydrolase [Nitrosomonas europaea]HRO55794.1 deoxyguanosinetriphosphate triphosphohydrolase [Nitrosomonas europaea]HRQ09229.1 deoxyguanosinetriphosphate triphosphohydrolase [Nitrosomonas europaea]HUM73522.1 deoxyguanosinetriphosphate triphosphohydrolase [Nitrosomonas europaea]